MEPIPDPVCKPGPGLIFSRFPRLGTRSEARKMWTFEEGRAREETRRTLKPGRKANPEEQQPLSSLLFWVSFPVSVFLRASRWPFSPGLPVSVCLPAPRFPASSGVPVCVRSLHCPASRFEMIPGCIPVTCDYIGPQFLPAWFSVIFKPGTPDFNFSRFPSP